MSKGLYYTRCEFSFDNINWHTNYTTSNFNYGEVPALVLYGTINFEEAKELIENHLMNYYFDKTFFRKKEFVRIGCVESPCYVTIKKEDFNGIYIRHKTVLLKNNYCYDTLSEKLPATEFLDWLKDHGINESLA